MIRLKIPSRRSLVRTDWKALIINVWILGSSPSPFVTKRTPWMSHNLFARCRRSPTNVSYSISTTLSQIFQYPHSRQLLQFTWSNKLLIMTYYVCWLILSKHRMVSFRKWWSQTKLNFVLDELNICLRKTRDSLNSLQLQRVVSLEKDVETSVAMLIALPNEADFL